MDTSKHTVTIPSSEYEELKEIARNNWIIDAKCALEKIGYSLTTSGSG